MASTSEIKNRIASVKETQKITNAMYLIASTKLRKARNDLDNTRPYFYELRSEIKRIFRTVNDVDSPYFYPPDYDPADHVGGTYGCLVITADKGLAGAYNLNVLKKAQKLLDDHSDMKLFVVGEYGRRFFEQRNIPIERSFLYTAQNPTLERAREISSFLLEQYDRYYRLALSYVHKEEDAADIVQNGAYKAILNSSSLKNPEYASTWVYRIMLNEIFSFYREKRVASLEEMETERETLSVEDTYENFDLKQALNALSKEDKAVVELRYFEDMKLEEISEILEENISTVKSRLYRSLKKLKVKLGEHEEAV